MEKKIFPRKVARDGFIRVYLLIFNGLLSLTKREADVLEEGIKGMVPVEDIGENGTEITHVIFSNKEIRAHAASKLGLSNHNINNLIKNLKDKTALVLDNKNRYTLNPRLAIKDINKVKGVEIIFKIEVE